MNNEEKAMKLFQGVTDVGDDLIEEAGVVQKRKKTASWRWGLIAACLCAALLGTAGAARFAGVWLEKGMRGDMPGVEMHGGMSYFPLDSFSEEIRALEGTNTNNKFQSWQEIEDFIGMDLMNNPVLDAAVIPDAYYRFKQGGKRGNFFVRVSKSLDFIDTLSAYKVDDVIIDMRACLSTERTTDIEGWDERFYGVYFPNQSEIEMDAETYTSPSGLEARIVRVGDTHMAAGFSISGVSFVLQLRLDNVDGDMKTGREVLIRVLDGFQV